jgi:hypothetical protein
MQNLDDIMSGMVGYYLMLFRALPFMNLRCWRPFYELSDRSIYRKNQVISISVAYVDNNWLYRNMDLYRYKTRVSRQLGYNQLKGAQ